MTTVRGTLKGVGLVVILMATFAAGWTVATFGIGRAADPSSLPVRERQFSERMKGSSLIGVFTLDGRPDRPAAPDRYDVSSVDKIGADRWRFNVRMRHSIVDVTLPVIVPLQWIDDMPAIIMTNYMIPGLGSFSARVLFDGDRYAGTWQNGRYGGHMYGRIVKQAASSN